MLILAKDGDTAAYIVQINTSNFFCHMLDSCILASSLSKTNYKEIFRLG